MTVVRANGQRQSWVSFDFPVFESDIVQYPPTHSLKSFILYTSATKVQTGLSPGQRYSRSIVERSGRALEILVCNQVMGTPDYAVRTKYLSLSLK